MKGTVSKAIIIPVPGMTKEEFLKWVDRDGDGRINQAELRRALRAGGLVGCWWKAWRAMNCADVNRNGVIDSEAELKRLVDFLRKHWGFNVK